MSSSGKQKRSRIQLRHALYTKLEAAVREEISCESNNSKVNHSCTRWSTSTHSSNSNNSSSNNSSSNNTDNNKNDNNYNNKDSYDETCEDAVTTATNRVDYPFPLLWFEEMTPSDLDSYHANNCQRNNMDQQQARKKNPDTNSVSQAARTRPFHDGAAKTNARASPYASATFSAAARPPFGGGVDVETAGIGGTRSNSEHMSIPASTATAAAPAPGDSIAREGFTGGALQKKSGSVECLPVTERTTVDTVRATANPSAPPAVSYSVVSLQEATEYAPNKSTLDDCGIAEKPAQSLQASSRTSSAADVTCTVDGKNLETSAVIAAGAQGSRPPHHHYGGLMSQATTQGTQRSVLAFLPGLPSQVMMTQQGNNEPDSVGCWEDHEDEMEEERDALVSECIAGSPPLPEPSTVDPLFRGDDAEKDRAIKNDCFGNVGEGAGRAVTFEPPELSGDGDLAYRQSGGTCRATTERGNKRSSTNGQRARAAEFEAFTQALEQTSGDGSASHNIFDTGDQARRQRSSTAILHHSRRSHGATTHLGLVMVPTDEALPRGVEGGQAGAIDLLEKHLRRVRERGVSEGYTARAIELALHVLSQPEVCTRSMLQGARTGCIGAVARGSPQQGEYFPTRAVEHHVEVVGVAGLVWEILRSGHG
ncbi:unnamed protein product [Sphacelaria rigidula]